MTKFNAGDPAAYFITWTSYGTWLPGDDRGWWRKGQLQEPNELFYEMASGELEETPFTLSAEDRDLVKKTIARHCQIRGWKLHTARARSNHVHVVVTASGYKPKTVRDQLKAWCTRELKHCIPVEHVTGRREAVAATSTPKKISKPPYDTSTKPKTAWTVNIDNIQARRAS